MSGKGHKHASHLQTFPSHLCRFRRLCYGYHGYQAFSVLRACHGGRVVPYPLAGRNPSTLEQHESVFHDPWNQPFPGAFDSPGGSGPQLSAYSWTSHELSNRALEKEIADSREKEDQKEIQILEKALSWSRKVNEQIAALPLDELQPFPGVKEALEAAHREADIAVVSSANKKAVEEEWQRCGLAPMTDVLLTQDDGSKAFCIGELIKKGYFPENVLMLGDAPGDEKAALANNVLFYPVLVKQETASWERFRPQALPKFLQGSYAGTYQEELTALFHDNLKGKA